MKFKVVTFFLLIFQLSFCQNFKNDWRKFVSENWALTYSKPEKFLDKETQGTLSFVNIKDKNKSVRYYVYLSKEINLDFEKKISNYYHVQSCIFEKTEYKEFESFHLGKYYYLVEGCHHCDEAKNMICVKLAEDIYEHSLK